MSSLSDDARRCAAALHTHAVEKGTPSIPETLRLCAASLDRRQATIDHLRAENEELRAALAPFAADVERQPEWLHDSNYLDAYGVSGITVGDVRRAAAVLAGGD